MKRVNMKADIRRLFKRKAETSKGDYGKIFVLAGSLGMTGAAYLTCMGALRSGAGLVTLGVANSLNSIMEIKLTEAMTLPLESTECGCLAFSALDKVLEFAKKQSVLILGPGISRNIETQKLVREIVLSVDIPIVLDADGINSFQRYREMLAKIKSFGIITPHSVEFFRLFDIDISAIKKNRLKVATEMSLKSGLTIVLKGNQTVVVDGKRQYVNNTGNAGLATGGSGDVLTGMIGAFLGQGLDRFDASKYAVYLHGLAGDLAAKDKTKISLLPSDLVEYLPKAFKVCGL